MKYTKKEIGEWLSYQLSKGYDVVRISDWAFAVFISMRDQRSPELDYILNHIMLMGAGPEFEYTEQELKLLIELLINEVEDPIKKLNDLGSNKTVKLDS